MMLDLLSRFALLWVGGLLAPGENLGVTDGDGERESRGGKFHVADEVYGAHGCSSKAGCPGLHCPPT